LKLYNYIYNMNSQENQTLTLPIEPFSISKANEICDDRNVIPASDYIKQYFYHTSSCSDVYFYDAKKKVFNVHKYEEIKKMYFKQLNKFYRTEFFENTSEKYDLVVDAKLPLLSPGRINLFTGVMHNQVSFSNFPKETQDAVHVMLGFYKEVWSNDDKDMYEYIIKWITKMIKGGKNNSIIYLKTIQGVGKSTGSDFLINHVIGRRSAMVSNSSPLTGEFNYILLAKLLVVFEELETRSGHEWQSVSSKLKQWSTGSTLMYNGKFMNQFITSNISNYIINTNENAVKDSDGRRYVNLDLNPKYANDHKYWKTLYNTCFNDTVGHAFYCYLIEHIDIDNFNSQEIPETRAKRDATDSRLHPLFKFLKFTYIIPKKNDKKRIDDLLNEFNNSTFVGNKPIKKNEMTKKLAEIGFNYSKSGSKNYYKLDNSLHEIAIKFKWFSEHDDDDMEQLMLSTGQISNSHNLDCGACDQVEQLKKQIEELKKQLKESKKDKKIKKKKVEPTEITKGDKLYDLFGV